MLSHFKSLYLGEVSQNVQLSEIYKMTDKRECKINTFHPTTEIVKRSDINLFNEKIDFIFY